MDRDKALDKIAKCLRLGKSSNTHEAAAALRQAQKLMAQYSVTEAEVNGIHIARETVGFKERRKPTVPLYAQAVATLVKRALGVEPIFSTRLTGKHLRLAVEYVGPEARVKMAVHAHTVIMRAMHQEWLARRELMGDYAGDRLSFYLGWLQAVKKEVQDYGIGEEERSAIDSKTLTLYGQTVTDMAEAKSRNATINDETAAAGLAAGSKFKLHRPMGEAQKAITKQP